MKEFASHIGGVKLLTPKISVVSIITENYEYKNLSQTA
jgi:hypothetical protein